MRVGPIGFDTSLSDQRGGDVAIGRAGEPPIESLQDHAEASVTGVGLQAPGKTAERSKTVETLERAEACPDVLAIEDRIRQQADWTEQARSRDGELEGSTGIEKQEVLQPIRCQEDRGLARYLGQAQRRRLMPLIDRKRHGGQDMRADLRIPEDGSIGGVLGGGVGEKTPPSVRGRGARPPRSIPSNESLASRA